MATSAYCTFFRRATWPYMLNRIGIAEQFKTVIIVKFNTQMLETAYNVIIYHCPQWRQAAFWPCPLRILSLYIFLTFSFNCHWLQYSLIIRPICSPAGISEHYHSIISIPTLEHFQHIYCRIIHAPMLKLLTHPYCIPKYFLHRSRTEQTIKVTNFHLDGPRLMRRRNQNIGLLPYYTRFYFTTHAFHNLKNSAVNSM